MINWVLEVEDVGDVACIVDDMEATGGFQSLVQRGGVREGGDKGTRGEVMEALSSVQQRKAVETPTSSHDYGIYLVA